MHVFLRTSVQLPTYARSPQPSQCTVKVVTALTFCFCTFFPALWSKKGGKQEYNKKTRQGKSKSDFGIFHEKFYMNLPSKFLYFWKWNWLHIMQYKAKQNVIRYTLHCTSGRLQLIALCLQKSATASALVLINRVQLTVYKNVFWCCCENQHSDNNFKTINSW